MSVNSERSPGLIYIEKARKVRSPSTRPQPVAVAPGPNYIFRRIGRLNVFFPNNYAGVVNEGALDEPPPPPLGPHPLQPLPSLEVPQLQQPPAERRLSSRSQEYRRLLENLNGGPKMRNNHFGKFSPECWGRIVRGVGQWWHIATCFLYLGFLYNTTFMAEIFIKHFGKLPAKAAYLIAGCLGLSTVCTFLLLGLTDPGVVPKNYTLRELLAETKEYRARHPGQRYYSYCSECRTCRPPRTFHCPTCDICIRGHEGHLKAAGRCVGERSRRAYLFHVIFQTLYGTFLLVISVIITIKIITGSTTNTREIIHLIVSWEGGIVLLFILDHGSIFKLVSKMYLLCVGRTATEEYRRRHEQDTNDCFVERLSVGGNIRNFFCKKSMPSAFRKIRTNCTGYGQYDMPDAWILEEWPGERPTVQMRGVREFTQIEMRDLVNDIANANVNVIRIEL